ncbi:hypothetical protein FMM55_06750 [Campylobacter sp. LR196d]|nr:hypothetical protein [Campylobacter sp. LR196d]KAA6225498.1 hypothetical protein FMM55_06750 [Campylobacter sp. LR196d]
MLKWHFLHFAKKKKTKEIAMRAYFINAENISLNLFLEKHNFDEEDKNSKFHIFACSRTSLNFKSLYILNKYKFKVYTFDNHNENYADKQILTTLGFVVSKKKYKEFIIVSDDKIFNNLEYMIKNYGKNISYIRKKDLIERNLPTTSTSTTSQTQSVSNLVSGKINISDDKLSIEKFCKKYKDEILNIRNNSNNLNNLHLNLTKHFGQDKVIKLYRYINHNLKDELKLSKLKNKKEVKQAVKKDTKNLTIKDEMLQKQDEIQKMFENYNKQILLLEYNTSTRCDFHNALRETFGNEEDLIYQYIKHILKYNVGKLKNK